MHLLQLCPGTTVRTSLRSRHDMNDLCALRVTKSSMRCSRSTALGLRAASRDRHAWNTQRAGHFAHTSAGLEPSQGYHAAPRALRDTASTLPASLNALVCVRQVYAMTPSDHMSWLAWTVTCFSSSNAMTASGGANASAQCGEIFFRLPARSART
jgi:hypothetical protein